MAQTSRIVELANTIAANTAKVDDYIRTNGLKPPSFEPDGPTDMTLPSAEVEEVRVATIGAAMELQDLLQGPGHCMRPMVHATSLQAIYKYDIPSKVPLNSTISFKDLAEKCQLYEPDLRRIVRFAIVHHRVFQEPQLGHVGHSAASRLLVDDPAAFDLLGMMYDESWQAFARTCDAMEKFHSQEPNETGYALAHNTDKTVWEYYAAHPDRGRRFANSMKAFTSNTGQSLSHLVSGYDWSSIGNGSTVVDMGGSGGHTSIAIAKAHPGLNFVVQDLPDTIKSAKLSVDVDESVARRIQLKAHDFFDLQDVVGDVYLFRWIFHDWPDTYVVKILRNLTPALKKGAKVIVNDQLLPEPGSVPLVIEKQVRYFDMTMLSFFNARERDRKDWSGLFEEADARFQDVRIWVPEGSSFAIIEATWTP